MYIDELVKNLLSMWPHPLAYVIFHTLSFHLGKNKSAKKGECHFKMQSQTKVVITWLHFLLQ